jgi:hypothetical protein|nr:MAG TPA: hypothetical protein [Caudoviricetes sp.]
MALINDLYVFVEDEDLNHDIESTTHPVETGIEITDHIRKKPVELNLKGKIVDYEGIRASETLEKVKQLQNEGTIITYVGRNLINGVQIQTLSTSHPNTNSGGCDFSMTLKEVRFAQPALVPETSNGGQQQVEQGENEEVYHIVKPEDTVWRLVSKEYKSLGPTFSSIQEKCDWVMENNLHAFSRPWDFTTLQNGERILIGVRK